MVINTPKNGKPRTVDMTKHLTDVLRELKGKRFKESLKAGVPMPELAFAYKGEMMSSFVYQRAVNRCLEKAGLKSIRIHDLRHSYATIRLLKGHNIGDVSYQLGHASIKITYDVYAHWIPGTFKSEIDELDVQPNATQAQPKKEASKK